MSAAPYGQRRMIGRSTVTSIIAESSFLALLVVMPQIIARTISAAWSVASWLSAKLVKRTKR